MLVFRGDGVPVFLSFVRTVTVIVMNSLEKFRYWLSPSSKILCSSEAVKPPSGSCSVPDTVMYSASVGVHVSLKNTKPALQAQLVWFCFVVDVSGHVLQFTAAVLENVLLEHASHAASPANAFTLPAAHATHFPAPLVYPAAQMHASLVLTSFLPHDLKLPSFIETGTVARSTSLSIGGVAAFVAFAIEANDCGSVASRYISTAILSLSTTSDTKTFTRLSEMLYNAVTLAVSSSLSSGKFVSVDEFVPFASCKSRNPLSRTLSP